ncbi:hypothetical protein MNBD_ALPHA12-1720 [hydrothermal vent metagenome]|uniref:Uncharacterized protein n=1 Tax=hydrothermal vent metagenome TaxID=652676 RepID=A0A3B0U3H4_9ZZZZ
MPTLIRFLIFILFLSALVFSSMVALVVFVDPAQKEVSIRIPASDLLGPVKR